MSSQKPTSNNSESQLDAQNQADRLARAKQILDGFMYFCRRNNMLEKGHKFWAVYDYLHGCRADKWYRDNARETLEFLDSLDSSKREAAELQEIARGYVVRWVDD